MIRNHDNYMPNNKGVFIMPVNENKSKAGKMADWLRRQALRGEIFDKEGINREHI